MRTKCRRHFQHAAATAFTQRGSGNSRPPYQTDAPHRASVHYMTISARGVAAYGNGAGSGSEYSTVSRETARVSATYSRWRPRASASAIRAGSTTIT
jgi:hypothetical protein